VLTAALSELGMAQLDAGQTAPAVASLARVMEMGSPPPGARTAYARALFRNGEYAAAASQWSAMRVEQPALATEAVYAMMVMRTLAQEKLLRDPARPLEDIKGMSRADLEERMDTLAAEMAEVAAGLPPDLVTRGHVRADSDPAIGAQMGRLRDLKLRLAATAAEYIVRGHPIREFAFTGGMQASLRDWKLPKADRSERPSAPPPLDLLGPEQRAEYEASKAARKSKRAAPKKQD
jgi:hypothetical protein